MEVKKEKKKPGPSRQEYTTRVRNDIHCGKPNCSLCASGGRHEIYYIVRFYYEDIRRETSVSDLNRETILAAIAAYKEKKKEEVRQLEEERLSGAIDTFPQDSDVNEELGERLDTDLTFPQDPVSVDNPGERTSWVEELVGENIGERQPWVESYDLDIPEVNFAPRNDVPLQHPDGQLVCENGRFILKKIQETS